MPQAIIPQPCSALEKLTHYTAVQSRALIVVAQPSLITFALLEPFNKGMEAKKLFLHIALLLAKLKGEVFVRHLATPRKICERLLLKVFKYRISANSFRGNYSFLKVEVRLLFKGGNYSREETIVFLLFH